jgi:hypothetical protein
LPDLRRKEQNVCSIGAAIIYLTDDETSAT